MKQLILFIILITSFQCIGQQALSTMARSPYPNMMVTSNAQRYMRYQFASDFATTFGDSLPNIYNKSDSVTDGNRTVFLKQNGSLTISAKHEFELFPHSGLRILTKTGSDDDLATRAFSVIGSNNDSVYLIGGSNRWYLSTRERFRIVSKAIEIYTDSARLDFNESFNKFTDITISPKGLQYAGDYSATFASNSLITKLYLQNSIAAIPNTSLQSVLPNMPVSINAAGNAFTLQNTTYTVVDGTARSFVTDGFDTYMFCAGSGQNSFSFNAATGGNLASPGAIGNGKNLGEYIWTGYLNGAYQEAGYLRAVSKNVSGSTVNMDLQYLNADFQTVLGIDLSPTRNLVLGGYPNTRNDAGNPVNVISTDVSGNLQSHPISELSNGITFLKDSRVYDFPSCPANSAIFVNFVITGAIQGASGTAGLDQNLGNECFLTVTVGASGFVSVALRNTGIVAFDAPSGTLKTVINNF